LPPFSFRWDRLVELTAHDRAKGTSPLKPDVALLVTTWSDADAEQKKVLFESITGLGCRIDADSRRLELTSDGFERT
jgi:hypothetical protein